jgi:hypothetical protein
VHLQRFTKNSFFLEKNPTIVNFPIRNLDLLEYVHAPLRARIVAERERAARNEPAVDVEARNFGSTRYDLVGNIRHEGSKPGEGTFARARAAQGVGAVVRHSGSGGGGDDSAVDCSVGGVRVVV